MVKYKPRKLGAVLGQHRYITGETRGGGGGIKLGSNKKGYSKALDKQKGGTDVNQRNMELLGLGGKSKPYEMVNPDLSLMKVGKKPPSKPQVISSSPGDKFRGKAGQQTKKSFEIEMKALGKFETKSDVDGNKSFFINDKHFGNAIGGTGGAGVRRVDFDAMLSKGRAAHKQTISNNVDLLKPRNPKK
jgi:hypothetical protein